MKDMWETYLPAFEALVTEADVESVMGAYNRTNGEPCCGHTYLMEEVLRGKMELWKGILPLTAGQSRISMKTTGLRKKCQGVRCPCPEKGCDVNCGNTYLHLLGAIEDGLITEEDITLAAERLFTTRFLLGHF